MNSLLVINQIIYLIFGFILGIIATTLVLRLVFRNATEKEKQEIRDIIKKRGTLK